VSLVRAVLDGLVPYEPGKPEEEVQRELGLDRVVKLASNEGPWSPFPAALEALARAAPLLNRYPDGGAYYLRNALAERHGVGTEQIVTGAGADAIIGHLSVATLDPGDEIVTGWPSFISYVLDAMKLGAVPLRVPLRDDHLDLEAMAAAVTPRTKLVYIATPNNPTGTMTGRRELDAYFERVPEHVLTVIDQAYFEYIDHPDYPDAVAEYLSAAERRVLVLRTFSKIYGLAGLRVGYGVGPPDVITAIGKTRRAFDVNTQAQVAALASLDQPAEIERRRALTAEGRMVLEATLREHGLDPAGPAVANFLFVDVGEDARPFFEALLRQGAIVRPMSGFGAPNALRITVGTPEENIFFAEALAAVRAATA
jgi:histidinol-phosphate aminotransferase